MDMVKNMGSMYGNCHNITGAPYIGNNVTYAAYAFEYCKNISG